MPRYVYECEECGSKTDQYHDYSRKPNLIHCECGGVAYRIITAPIVRIPKPTSDARRGRGQG